MNTFLRVSFLFLFIATIFRTQSFGNDSESSPVFYYQLHNIAAADSSQSKLLVTVGIKYDDLNFIKTTKGFEALYRIGLQVYKQDSVLVDEIETSQRFSVSEYRDTQSEVKYNSHLFEFDLAPGDYQASFLMNDHVSGKSWQATVATGLQNFVNTTSDFTTSDIVLLEHVELDSLKRLHVAPGKLDHCASPNKDFYLYLELFSSKDRSPIEVRQIIRNHKGEKVLDQRRNWKLRQFPERLVLPFSTDLLPYGTYQVEMEIRRGESIKKLAEIFRIVWDGIPESAVHLTQALEEALEIANPSEKKSIEEVVANGMINDRRQALIEFWATRDSNPLTPNNEAMAEYYHRLHLEQRGLPKDREMVLGMGSN